MDGAPRTIDDKRVTVKRAVSCIAYTIDKLGECSWNRSGVYITAGKWTNGRVKGSVIFTHGSAEWTKSGSNAELERLSHPPLAYIYSALVNLYV